MVLHIFTYNFLNIQPIFNLQKVLESWHLGLSNHSIKYYVCQSMLEMSKVKITFDTSDIDSIWWYGWESPKSQLFKTFCGFKIGLNIKEVMSKDVCMFIQHLRHAYVSLRLRVQNAVPAQPCVGKLGISLVLLNFLHCNFRLWFKTP